jgi:hypothetical protein
VLALWGTLVVQVVHAVLESKSLYPSFCLNSEQLTSVASGWCGNTTDYCNASVGCQSAYGTCNNDTTTSGGGTGGTSTNGQCGPGQGTCASNECCSFAGFWYVFFSRTKLPFRSSKDRVPSEAVVQADGCARPGLNNRRVPRISDSIFDCPGQIGYNNHLKPGCIRSCHIPFLLMSQEPRRLQNLNFFRHYPIHVANSSLKRDHRRSGCLPTIRYQTYNL